MTRSVWIVVAAFAAFEIAINFTPYGYFIDELYYLACAQHLAFRYVDHPPLSIGVLAMWTAIAGTSMILCTSYGVAGAIERLAPDLPPVYATHNSYWEWGPPPPERDLVVAIDASTALFAERIHEGVHHCPYRMSWRDGMEITIAKKPTAPIQARWAEMKHFE